MSCDMFTGGLRERELRLDYVLRQNREAQLAASRDKKLGFNEEPHLFVKQMHVLNSQSYGKRIQNYYVRRFGLEKVPDSEDRGDCKNSYDCYFEGKVSYKTVENQYSFIQIRPYQDLEGYFMICIDPDEDYKIRFFFLTRSQMNRELVFSGCAHSGTKLRRISLEAGTLSWDRWLCCYEISNEAAMKKILTKEFISDERRACVWKQGFVLIKGACQEELLSLPKSSVNLIATDLPYGTTQNKWDVIIPFDELWLGIKHVLKDNGIAVFTASQPFTSQLVMSNLKWFKYETIWKKTLGSGQLSINRRPLLIHESILVFYKKFGVYNEQQTVGSPYKIKRRVEKFEGTYGRQRDHESLNDGFRRACSVVTISNPRIRGGHKTQKPVELMEYIIKTYSNEGDVVLDCCMGSGTTGEACFNLNRNFIGIELNDEWFDKACLRIGRLSMQYSLF